MPLVNPSTNLDSREGSPEKGMRIESTIAIEIWQYVTINSINTAI